jgi:hypothetical protein
MGEIGYLEQLTVRLFEGIQPQSTDWRMRHASFLRNFQRPDGGVIGIDNELRCG